MLTKETGIHGMRRQRTNRSELVRDFPGKAHQRSSSVRTVQACGSVKRKLDSRWALIQENEMDLIFVDENEIIYPKRINVDKGGLVRFSGFRTDDRF